MSIGVFARRSWLSLKALRLYERLGLLVPVQVGADNGYRRYHERQLATARLIVMLRRLDMPLAEVAAVVAAASPQGAEVSMLRAGHGTTIDAPSRREPAHREAFVRITKAQVQYPQILSAFDAVAQWLTAQGLSTAVAPREVYFIDFAAAKPTDAVCDVAFPMT